MFRKARLNSKMLIKSRLDVPSGTSGDLLPQNSVLDRQAALILLGNKTKLPDVKKVLQFDASFLKCFHQQRFRFELMPLNAQFAGRQDVLFPVIGKEQLFR